MRQEIHEQLDGLKAVDDDWTDYEGYPVTVAARKAMRGLLDALMSDDTPAPTIYAVEGENICVDWDTGAAILSITTVNGGGFECYEGSMIDDSGFDEWTTDGADDRLRELVAKITEANRATRSTR